MQLQFEPCSFGVPFGHGENTLPADRSSLGEVPEDVSLKFALHLSLHGLKPLPLNILPRPL
jgi:hypothetical protein